MFKKILKNHYVNNLKKFGVIRPNHEVHNELDFKSLRELYKEEKINYVSRCRVNRRIKLNLKWGVH